MKSRNNFRVQKAKNGIKEIGKNGDDPNSAGKQTFGRGTPTLTPGTFHSKAHSMKNEIAGTNYWFVELLKKRSMFIKSTLYLFIFS